MHPTPSGHSSWEEFASWTNQRQDWPLTKPAVPSGHSPSHPIPPLPFSLPLSPGASFGLPFPFFNEAQYWTTKQGPKNHVEMHTAGFSRARSWNSGCSSLRICPVCSRLISTRTRPCCPTCHPASTIPTPSWWNDPQTPTHQTWTKFLSPGSAQESHPKGRPRSVGLVSPGCPDRSHLQQRHPGLDRPPVPPETCPPPGTRRHTEQQMLFHRHVTNV